MSLSELNLPTLRREYMSQGLSQSDLPSNPIKQFELWFTQAQKADIQDPSAMVVASVGHDGQPSARNVLWKRVYFLH